MQLQYLTKCEVTIFNEATQAIGIALILFYKKCSFQVARSNYFT
jgi:hypothetical protein